RDERLFDAARHPFTRPLVRRCSGSSLCSSRPGTIRASNRSPGRKRRSEIVEAAVPAALLNLAGGTPATTAASPLQHPFALDVRSKRDYEIRLIYPLT